MQIYFFEKIRLCKLKEKTPSSLRINPVRARFLEPGFWSQIFDFQRPPKIHPLKIVYIHQFKTYDQCFATAGKDAIISVWNLEHTQANKCPLHSVATENGLRALVSTSEEEGFLVGTLTNEILTILPHGSLKTLTTGHNSEVTGLAVSDQNFIVTTGQIPIIRNCETKKVKIRPRPHLEQFD